MVFKFVILAAVAVAVSGHGQYHHGYSSSFLGPHFSTDLGSHFRSDFGSHFRSDLGSHFRSDFGSNFRSDLGSHFTSDFGSHFRSGLGSHFSTDYHHLSKGFLHHPISYHTTSSYSTPLSHTFKNYNQQPTVTSYTSSPRVYSRSRLIQPAPVVQRSYSFPRVYSTPITQSYHHEPEVHELATHIETSGGYSHTKTTPQAPIIHESYTPAIVHKTLEPAPVVHETYVPEITHHETFVPQITHETVEPAPALSAVVKTESAEPTISEYSTYVASAPAFTETKITEQAPIVHETYVPETIHKTLEPAPIAPEIVHQTVEPVAVIKTESAEPTISEYSTYTASAPAFTETKITEQAPIVHETFVPEVVHKTLEPAVVHTEAHEPTISEFSTYTASAPAFHETRIAEQAPLVHETYTPEVVHKSFEPLPVVHYNEPAETYGPPAW